jgi:hypothetical protein
MNGIISTKSFSEALTMFLLHLLFFPYYLCPVLRKNIVINVVFRLYDATNILTNTQIKFDYVVYHNSLNFSFP